MTTAGAAWRRTRRTASEAVIKRTVRRGLGRRVEGVGSVAAAADTTGETLHGLATGD